LGAILQASCAYIHQTGESKASNTLEKVRTLAGLNREFGEPYGVAVRNGEIFVTDGEKGHISKIDKYGNVTVVATGLHTPSAITFNSKGELIVADTGSHTIKGVAADGRVTTIAGIENQSGDTDGPAASALFNGPVGLAVVPDNRIFVADTYNDKIKVIKDGQVSTIAGSSRGFADGPGNQARFDTPLGLAIMGDKLLVADSANGRVRVVEPDGTTWTLAGSGSGKLKNGPLATSSFDFPTAIAVGPGPQLFVADGNAIRVIGRRVLPSIETISAEQRGLLDGQARSSRFNRPSGLAIDDTGDLIVADSDNQLVRVFSDIEIGKAINGEDIAKLRYSPAEFRSIQPARWPYDPPDAKREIAGTLGEVRGVVAEGKQVWFHNGLDIAGGYGETARFVRTETVLEPLAVENFGSPRELLRMPTMGYIHNRMGRDQNDRPLGDPRFQFERDDNGKITGLRIPRGTVFKSGDPLGTLNALNHVHLIAGRSGEEMNALDALVLPGVSDSISPVIESVYLANANWDKLETRGGDPRIKLLDKTRVIVRAYDRVDGNVERRRLGVYKLGYQIFRDEQPLSDINWSISFERMPANEAVRFVYAPGSRSGYTPDTVFDYVVTNNVSGDDYGEGFIDPTSLASGRYTVRVFAADFFGNTATKEISFEVSK
jgi:hypothetical protein